MHFRLNRRTTDCLGATGLVLLAAATYGLGIRPVRERTTQAAVASAVTTERETELAEVLTDQASTRLAIESSRTALADAFPLRDLSRQNERLGELTGAAEESGLALDEMRPGTPLWDWRFGAVPIRMSGSGGYQHFVTFLSDLSTAFPDLRVVSFTLHAQPGSAAPPTFATELVWFTLPQNATATERAAQTVPGGAVAKDRMTNEVR